MPLKSSTIKTLDLLFGQLIRKRGRCEMGSFCDKSTLQVSHNFSRGGHSIITRWMETNVLLLCNKHHRIWEGEMTKIEREEYLKQKIGEVAYGDLLRAAKGFYKFNEVELKELKDVIKKRIHEESSYQNFK